MKKFRGALTSGFVSGEGTYRSSLTLGCFPISAVKSRQMEALRASVGSENVAAQGFRAEREAGFQRRKGFLMWLVCGACSATTFTSHVYEGSAHAGCPKTTPGTLLTMRCDPEPRPGGPPLGLRFVGLDAQGNTVNHHTGRCWCGGVHIGASDDEGGRES